jgi:NifB/MoaA-like Fe-S oxidoreductase
MKKRSREEILFKTVKEDNILPITSICKLNCIFCSHKNNPPQIETHSFGHLEKELIKTMIEFLDPDQPVFIGESASKIIEGEPFVHPEIYQILEYLRQRWLDIEIKITTSASFLKIEKLNFLKTLEPLELNISLNAPAPEERVFLMNDSRPNNVFKIIPELKKLKFKFSASIVSMHHLKGFDYLRRTFDYLEKYQPEVLRVFMAGFSRYADPEIVADAGEYQKLKQFIDKIRNDYSYPIIPEPQLLNNFKAEINDIIKNSPAAETDLKAGDIIEKVDQKAVVSRVNAFYQIKAAKNPEVEVQRAEKNKKIIIKKEKDDSSGLIMSYDLNRKDKNTLKAYADQSSKNKKGITVILASEAGYELLFNLIKNNLKATEKLKLLKVKNELFGASIIAAGLLTNYDIIKSLNKIDKNIEKIILPEIVYDYYGNDLLGNHYTELEEKFRAELILI